MLRRRICLFHKQFEFVCYNRVWYKDMIWILFLFYFYIYSFSVLHLLAFVCHYLLIYCFYFISIPENPIQTIVVDPGTRAFEGSSPGLLYSVISRITTLGYPHDIFTSPLFFTGFNMTRERLQHITLRKDGRTYAKVLLRKKWVAFLKQRSKSTTPLSTQQKHQISSWIHSYRCSTAAVSSKIMLYSELLSKLPPA